MVIDKKTIERAAPFLEAFENMALMVGTYKGEKVDFLCAAVEDGDDICMYPIAIMITDAMAEDCADPEGRLPG